VIFFTVLGIRLEELRKKKRQISS